MIALLSILHAYMVHLYATRFHLCNFRKFDILQNFKTLYIVDKHLSLILLTNIKMSINQR